MFYIFSFWFSTIVVEDVSKILSEGGVKARTYLPTKRNRPPGGRPKFAAPIRIPGLETQ